MIWKTKLVEITAERQNIGGKKVKRNEDSLRDLWDNIKWTNICMIGVPRREKVPEKICEEVIAENLFYMGK